MSDGPDVQGEPCPRCELPRDEDAWRCDGCGHEFGQDFEAVRGRLRARLRAAWITLAVMVLVDAGIVAAFVFLAAHRWLYVSGGLALAAIGSTGHAVFKISTLREHLDVLDRRHRPLPTATARHP